MRNNRPYVYDDVDGASVILCTIDKFDYGTFDSGAPYTEVEVDPVILREASIRLCSSVMSIPEQDPDYPDPTLYLQVSV